MSPVCCSIQAREGDFLLADALKAMYAMNSPCIPWRVLARESEGLSISRLDCLGPSRVFVPCLEPEEHLSLEHDGLAPEQQIVEQCHEE